MGSSPSVSKRICVGQHDAEREHAREYFELDRSQTAKRNE
jgi:hypothetical protein